MGFNFPNTPTQGTLFTPAGGFQYVYDGGVWRIVTTPTQLVTAEARNRIVNGAMQISQEWGNTSVSTAGADPHVADQWIAANNIAAIATTAQRVQVVTPNGSVNRIRVPVTTGNASIGAGRLTIVQRIEGVRVADFQYGTANAKQVVVRFGWKSPAGTYTVKLQNSASNRTYLVGFTVSAGQANTDTVQTIVVPGDTTGTWLTDTGVGLVLWVMLASTLTGVTGWQSGNFDSVPGQTNGAATTGNTFELFDCGLYLDPNATGLPPPWQMPDEAQEMAACMRYYEGLTISVAHSGVYGTHYFKAVKRIQPALSFSQAGFVDINADAKAFYASGSSTISIYWSASARM